MNTYAERVYVYIRRDRLTWPPEYAGRNTSNCVCEFMCTCMHTEKGKPVLIHIHIETKREPNERDRPTCPPASLDT